MSLSPVTRQPRVEGPDSFAWYLENRGGLASLLKLMPLPEELIPFSQEASEKIIANLTKKTFSDWKFSQIKLPIEFGTIRGVTCMPTARKVKDTCILYLNPNGVMTAEYFTDGADAVTPRIYASLRQLPLYLFDYRGTGLSRNSSIVTPTYESVVLDSLRVLEHAIQHYRHVELFGSSLGGGVAIEAARRYLERLPGHAKRLSIICHDTFSTSARVAGPHWRRTSDLFSWTLGSHIDAAKGLKTLVEKGVSVTVLNHTKDPIIPEGARLAEFARTLPESENLKIFESPMSGHANLSDDMIEVLT